MTAAKTTLSVIILIVVSVVMMSAFTVKETELALKLRFGKVVSADFAPGLHFRMPIIHKIRTFDKRIQTLDAQPEHFLTSEKKNLIVDSFIKWRIIDVVAYFKAVSGNPQSAKQRLAEIIADGLRSEFGKRTIKEVVSGDRAEIMDIITQEANNRVKKQFGIEIVDVRIKRIELPKEVSSSVYRRMEAERERDAKQLRSQGEAQAVRIRASADRERVEVVAKAERDANKIRGEGDATAADTYAQAYNKNPEFYALYRSLNAYKTTFANRGDILLIQPDSEFFRYFKALHGNTSQAPMRGMPNQEPALKQDSQTPEKEPVASE
jgi:modulator of FtsH protease HflC